MEILTNERLLSKAQKLVSPSAPLPARTPHRRLDYVDLLRAQSSAAAFPAGSLSFKRTQKPGFVLKLLARSSFRPSSSTRLIHLEIRSLCEEGARCTHMPWTVDRTSNSQLEPRQVRWHQSRSAGRRLLFHRVGLCSTSAAEQYGQGQQVPRILLCQESPGSPRSDMALQ